MQALELKNSVEPKSDLVQDTHHELACGCACLVFRSEFRRPCRLPVRLEAGGTAQIEKLIFNHVVISFQLREPLEARIGQGPKWLSTQAWNNIRTTRLPAICWLGPRLRIYPQQQPVPDPGQVLVGGIAHQPNPLSCCHQGEGREVILFEDRIDLFPHLPRRLILLFLLVRVRRLPCRRLMRIHFGNGAVTKD